MPDPRFSDQLAGWLFDFSMKARGVAARWADPSIGIPGDDGAELLSDRNLRAAWRTEADRLIDDVIAAEVEARVQAAANQRAKEVRRALAWAWLGHEPHTRDWDGPRSDEALEWADGMLAHPALAAALTSPAPAPRAEEGQR